MSQKAAPRCGWFGSTSGSSHSGWEVSLSWEGAPVYRECGDRGASSTLSRFLLITAWRGSAGSRADLKFTPPDCRARRGFRSYNRLDLCGSCSPLERRPTNDNENMTTQNLWDAAKAAKTYKREVYSNTILPLETRKTLNRQPNFTPKTVEKEEQQQQQ